LGWIAVRQLTYLWSMADQEDLGVPCVFVIPQPAVRRVIAITTVAFFLADFAILPFKLGVDRFLGSLAHFSATWVLLLMLVLPIGIFVRLAFPSRNSLPRLEVARDRIRVVPGRIARLFAEAPVEIAFTPQTREILLCHNVWQGLGDGLRLIVRGENGAEKEIRAVPIDYLSPLDAQTLAKGILAATGLPVRLLTRRRQADGTIQEAPWAPPSRSTRMIGGTALAMGAIPFVGGAIVGALWPLPAVIVEVGLVLWLIQISVVFLLARYVGSRAKFLTPFSLATVFTFAAAYGIAVVAVGFIFRNQ